MQGGLTFKFDKIPLIYSASYFNWGGLELCLGGLSPPKPPWRRDWSCLVPSSVALNVPCMRLLLAINRETRVGEVVV